MLLLLHAPKTRMKGVSNMLFIKHEIPIFGKNGHFVVTLGPPCCRFDPVSLRKCQLLNNTK